MEKKFFLKVFELKQKLLFLIKKTRQKKSSPKRSISLCDHCNGFKIVKKLQEGERKKMYRPLDIVYKPEKKIGQIVNCYFLILMRQAYHVIRDRGN